MKLNLEDSLAKALFLGQIVEENLFPYPDFEEQEAETLRIVLDSIKKFVDKNRENFVKFDREASQPDEFIQELRELGLFGIIIPEEYEGIGLSSKAYARVISETGGGDASASLTIGAHSSIGMKGLLLFGNEEQKAKYLPSLASGAMIAAFCLTEAGAGSDVASLRTKATKNEDGSWVLSGEKIWITNGPIADFFTVFAKTDSASGKISSFIVERGFEGVSVGPKEDKMGIRASSTATVTFDNVKVPAENLLGEEGKGFKIAMGILNHGRSGLGGGCVGAMKTLINLATNQAIERKQFGQPISSFRMVKRKLALMTANCFAGESVVHLVAHYIDSGHKDYSVESAIAKIFATEALWDVCYEALQIAGGNGFMREYPYEQITRDARINTIFEGTNEVLRLYVALSGYKDVGTYLKGVASGFTGIFNDPIKGFGTLSAYATKRFGQLTSLGRDRIDSIHPALRREASNVEGLVMDFSRVVETVLRRHGKEIIGKQLSSRRSADCAIYLFANLSVLSRVTKLIEQQGEEKSAKEISIAKVFSHITDQTVRQRLGETDKNVDNDIISLADELVSNKGYSWDTL